MRLLLKIAFSFILISVHADPLKVNLFCPDNGKGLSVDGQILKDSLTALGVSVYWKSRDKSHEIPLADINIFCEILSPDLFSYARLNWFIPNPEWCTQDIAKLESVDLILCRTHEASRIFNELHLNTFFLGFTTPDAQNLLIKKNFHSFIHVAGSSPLKGTSTVLSTWNKNKKFPFLTVIGTGIPLQKTRANLDLIKKTIPIEDLRKRQNQSGIHLCLSETEGFGHTLAEAMSCGSVVITTDAPPMNEFIQDPRYLVPYSYTTTKDLGTRYHVTSEALEAKMSEILKLPLSTLKESARKNREAYIQRANSFQENLKFLIEKSLSEKQSPL